MPTCAVCGSHEGISHFEDRRPNPDGPEQTFAFCESCWLELQRQRITTDPEICRRYMILCQYIIGGYRLQRNFNGNQTSRILPKELFLRWVAQHKKPSVT